MIAAPPAAGGVAALGDAVRSAYAELLDGVADVALLDYPNHVNIGDAAIWAGELAALRTVGVRVVYACDQRGYVPAHLRAALGPRTAILLHGGGNLGDLYPRHQRLRERVLTDFPERRTVLLPQSVAHAGEETAARMRALAARHRDLHVLARDVPTQTWYGEQLGVAAPLCPDSAFALGALHPPVARTGVLWLARTDPEAAAAAVALPAGVRRGDWPEPAATWTARRLVSRLASAATAAVPRGGGPLAARAPALFPRLAAERVRAGAAYIGGAGVVVTDRLHAHILSLLCGVSSVLHDNSTGKVRACFEQWTGDLPGVHWADSPEAALARAGELVRAP